MVLRRSVTFLTLMAVVAIGLQGGDATGAPMVADVALGMQFDDSAPEGGNSSEDGIRFELHTWLCPGGIVRDEYDFPADCEDVPLEGVAFELAEPRGAGNSTPGISSQKTDANGNVVWAEEWLGEGAYTLRQDETSLAALDVDIVDYVVRCAADDGPPGSVAAKDYAISSIFLKIPAATTTATCNWYNLPADDVGGGSVTLRAFACPNAYSSHEDCTEPTDGQTLDVVFGPSGGRTSIATDAEGIATIDTPAPSAAITIDGVTAPTVSCTDAEGVAFELDPAPPWFRAAPGYVSLDVRAGEEIICEWHIPSGYTS